MSFLRSSLLFCVLPSGCLGSLTYFGPPSADDPGPGTTSLSSSRPTSSTGSGTTPQTGIPIQLYAVDPPFGSDAGGQEIRLTGVFDAATEVQVGGTTAPVVSRSESVLVVTTPSSGVLGTVDVAIQSPSPHRQDVLTAGFEYFEDAAGEAGIIGMIGRYDVQGDYWSGPALDFAAASVAFVDGPSDWEFYQGYAPSLGGCLYDSLGTSTWPVDPALHDVGAADVTFQGPNGSLRLDDGTVAGGWYTGDFDASDLRANEAYDLQALSGTNAAAWPSYPLPGALQIPDGFTLIAPYLDTKELPGIPRQTTFQWTGGSGDYVLIQLRRIYQGYNGEVEDRVTCGVPDNGSFTLPANIWPDWFAGDLIYVYVGRVEVSREPLPHNLAENRLAGAYWVYGAGLSN